MSFLTPGFLWLFALALPVIALYFFRQRQREIVVPTNFLWVQAIEDTRTAAVLRRFLKSLLLLLQLIFLALLVLALAGATASLWSGGSARLVVAVVDRSASMTVADCGEEDAPLTRLEAARAALLDAVDGLRDDDRMMLVAVDEGAEVLLPYTGERERLRRAIESLEPRDLGTDLDEAVLLLRSQIAAAAGRTVEVLVLSDGAFPDPGGIDGAEVSFVPFGRDAANTGLTDLRIVRGDAGEASLFVSVEGFGPGEVDRTVALRRDGELLDARQATAPAGGQAVVFFPLATVTPGLLEVRLEGIDAFARDDVAWCVLRPSPPRRAVLYGGRNAWIERVLAIRAGLDLPSVPVTDPEALAALGRLDLVVYDGVVPDERPESGATIYVGCVPPDGPVTADGMLDYPPVIDWRRTHPLTRFADFSDLVVVEGLRLAGLPEDAVLVDSPQGPLLAWTETGDRRALWIPFDLAKSNWPLKLSFPLVMANTLDRFFTTRRPGDPEEVLRTGEAIERRLPPGGDLTVHPPGVDPVTVPAGPAGRAVFAATWRAGLHRLETAGGEDVTAASLLRRAESAIAPRSRVSAGGVEHEARPEAVAANLLLRDPLLWLALAILSLEWVLWLKRR